MAATKTGMLANADIIRAVAQTLKAPPYPTPALIDPVCVSTSGHTLLECEAIGVLNAVLLPLATVLTPNANEAELLMQHHQHGEDADLDPRVRVAAVVLYRRCAMLVRVVPGLCDLGPRATGRAPQAQGAGPARGSLFVAQPLKMSRELLFQKEEFEVSASTTRYEAVQLEGLP
jgi:Phosphomethylpyrimidine kinase